MINLCLSSHPARRASFNGIAYRKAGALSPHEAKCSKSNHPRVTSSEMLRLFKESCRRVTRSRHPAGSARHRSSVEDDTISGLSIQQMLDGLIHAIHREVLGLWENVVARCEVEHLRHRAGRSVRRP